jgi:acyl carrier protein
VTTGKIHASGNGSLPKREFLRLFEKALELDPNSISGEETLSAVGWWDSMASLVFMSVADENFNLTITGADLEKCDSVPDLLALLGDKISR